MTRPESNVTIGFREGSDELVLAYTESSAESNTIVPLTSETLDVHVYGRVFTESNVGIINTSPEHTLDVGSNLYVDEYGSNVLVVTGNTSITGDLTVDTDVLRIDSTNNKIGINTVLPDAELHVVGNVYASSNLTVDIDTFHVDVEADHVGINTKYPDAELHVVGNAYVSNTLKLDDPTTALITDLTANVEVKLNQLANVTIDTTTLANEDMLVYDGSNWTNQLQNHTFLYARADETIAKGDAVYATGTIGNNMFSIAKARSNSSATMPVLGVAYQAFTLNQEGLIVTFGRADGVDTDNFQTGETVYVSNVTAGALSNVKPYGPNDLIQNV